MTKPLVVGDFRAQRRRAALTLLHLEREAAQAAHACRSCGLELLQANGSRAEAAQIVTTDLVVECPECGVRNVLRLPGRCSGGARSD